MSKIQQMLGLFHLNCFLNCPNKRSFIDTLTNSNTEEIDPPFGKQLISCYRPQKYVCELAFKNYCIVGMWISAHARQVYELCYGVANVLEHLVWNSTHSARTKLIERSQPSKHSMLIYAILQLNSSSTHC